MCYPTRAYPTSLCVALYAPQKTWGKHCNMGELNSVQSRALWIFGSPFVHHAFASTSGQESIIWCLNELANRAHSSFAWFPAIELYRHGEITPLTDLDIIATVDGKVYLVEVKNSFPVLTMYWRKSTSWQASGAPMYRCWQ
jgi:hypothetical protein